MRILHIDPVGGLSGDMFLGALLHLGWPLESLHEELRDLGLDAVRVTVEERLHQGISCKGVVVQAAGDPGHRHLPDIERLLHGASAELAPHRRRALTAFRRLAAAEARIHGRELESVHLHEVGGLDSITDIVGVCRALSDLGIDQVTAGRLPLGRGEISVAHGRMPLPAPATLELLRGAPVEWTEEEGEKVTPTGAVLAVTLADRFGPPPPMTVDAVGWGGGARPTPAGGRPNVVRLVLGTTETESQNQVWETIAVLTCRIDDMTPQAIGELGERLMSAGALDVLVVPGLMKKGRPAWEITLLCRLADEGRLVEMLFAHSSTLGVRVRREERWVLPRRPGKIATPLGEVPVKWVRRGGVWTASAEFSSLSEISRRTGTPVSTILDRIRPALQAASPPDSHNRS
ncbi:MAG: nickel pincer cofactor biosynthesis protein LarC [Candidatus Eisenbacteria bacterium]|nr:nickel pincer cofactor biosynthesis protein LarC [Candidatus Eisenbacteria bacterium]